MEPLEDGDSLGDVGYEREGLMFYSPDPLPIYFLLPACQQCDLQSLALVAMPSL